MGRYRRRDGRLGIIEAERVDLSGGPQQDALLSWLNGGQRPSPHHMPPGASLRQLSTDPNALPGDEFVGTWALVLLDPTAPGGEVRAYPGDMIVRYGTGSYVVMTERQFERAYRPARDRDG